MLDDVLRRCFTRLDGPLGLELELGLVLGLGLVQILFPSPSWTRSFWHM